MTMKQNILLLTSLAFSVTVMAQPKPEIENPLSRPFETHEDRTEIIIPMVNGLNVYKTDFHIHTIYSDGEVSAGGAGEEGETESTGNASAWAQTFTPTNTTMPFEHNRATTDVIVQVYEKNDGGSWDMILVDVEIISETKVNLHFGRTENREHKIVIMG